MKKIYTVIAALLLWPVLSYSQNADSCAVANAIDVGSHDVDTLMGSSGSQGFESAWYTYTPSESGTIDVNSCYGGSDTRLYIHEGDCNALVQLASADDDCPYATDSTGSSFASSLVDISVIAGSTYYIEWDGRWSTNPFTFNLLFNPLPGPDSCEIAVVVEPGQYYADTLQGGAGSQGYNSAWYEFTAPADGFIDVTSCYGGTDTRLWIWEGDCAALVAVADTDDDCIHASDSTGSSFAAALYSLAVTSGTTYYIEWDGRWSSNPFFWNLTFAEPLQSCGTAEIVTAPSTTTVDTLTGDGGSQGFAASWYEYTPDMDGSINVSSCYGGSDTRLWIWEGTCDALVAVMNTDDDCIHATDSTGSSFAASAEGVNVTGGTTYYIEWDARWSSLGFDWTLEFSDVQIEAPVNDTCGGAPITMVIIDGATATNTGIGTGATDSFGLGVNQVWEAFTIDDCADVTIDFCGSAQTSTALFNVLYDSCPQGASVQTATIAGVDDCGDGSGSISASWVALDAGTYYYPVLVDVATYGGYDDYTINFTATGCAPSSDTCSTFLGGPWTDFNGTFGGAPVADVDGNCPFNEITTFEVWASESYTVDGFTSGEEYTFSMCGGSYGAWSAELTVWDENGVLVALLQDTCSITWTATYDGTYVIGINEVGACGAASSNTSTNNGFPALTCEGTVGVNDIEQADFAIYPNPNNGEFSIVNEGVDGEYLIELIDVTGKVVYSEQIQLNANDRSVINSTDVNTGVYLVKMTNTEANYYRTLRMVIK